jgi:phosphoribosylformylglycinamidine (FGAM) synthase-like enzyme
VTPATPPRTRHRELGLSDDEYALIVSGLGRDPGDVELAMLSLMWSEHCAYKHSRRLLRRLPTDSEHVLVGPGENAGAVDVGGGLAVAFKVESHNHPSAVEPFQGAATGVGGILRDVFAVGARPIAVLDSLRFGEIAGSARSRYLLEHAVAGIGHYGNSIGVPTVGGEIYFESAYEQNCLVNAMCVGLAPHQRLTRSAAAGPGNVLVLLGALTGRDGIGGASVLASAELGEGDAAKRPSVQIGDPFTEKKLLECCLELLERELLVSLQDLGAAGLTSAASEMASKGGVGIDIDVSRVPLREPGMAAFEIMVSESQERMLCVVAPERVAEVLDVCERWETLATPIGQITERPTLRVLQRGSVVGELPVALLVDDCPVYDLAPAAPSEPLYPAPAPVLGGGEVPAELLLALLESANIASRRPVFEQYDPVVQSRTVRRPQEADAAVLVLDALGATGPDAVSASPATAPAGAAPAPAASARAGAAPAGAAPDPAGAATSRDRDGEARPAIAISIDGNGRRVACDPRAGAAEAVYECAANLACVGAEPLGVTNCLNFGNPEKPHVAWQLTEAVEGLAEACRALGVAVVGGNVSLYNEAPAGPILPTPVIGMVGRLPDARRAGRSAFARAGDAVALVGPFAPAAAGSELAKLRGVAPAGTLPAVDVPALRRAHEWVRERVRAGALTSAHDIAEGGIAVALAECCLAGGLGARVELPDGLEPFGEAPGRGFVVSGAAQELHGARVIGRVGGETLELVGLLCIAVSELRAAFERGLARHVQARC